MFLVIGTFLFMEGVAWTTHKYVMHGILWSWHRSHHKKHDHALEKNDLFALVFSVPSIALIVSGYELTNVHFNRLDRDRLLKYIATGEPLDKAGAYGIQGAGGFLVDRIEGNLDNVIGLPMKLLDELAGRIIEYKESND